MAIKLYVGSAVLSSKRLRVPNAEQGKRAESKTKAWITDLLSRVKRTSSNFWKQKAKRKTRETKSERGGIFIWVFGVTSGSERGLHCMSWAMCASRWPFRSTMEGGGTFMAERDLREGEPTSSRSFLRNGSFFFLREMDSWGEESEKTQKKKKKKRQRAEPQRWKKKQGRWRRRRRKRGGDKNVILN